jgi:ankyrin repeat protein
MKPKLLNVVLGLCLTTLTQGVLACEKPSGEVNVAFKYIEQKNAEELRSFLKKVVVSKHALNEDCENMYLAAIRAGSQKTLSVLEEDGYGAKTPNERYLIKNTRLDYSYETTPFEHAVEYAPLTMIKLLANRGGELQVAKEKYKTLLMLATSNTKDVVEYFIRAGEEIDAKDFDGWTALFHASLGNSKDVVQTLIDAGANIHILNNVRETPLHLSATWNKIENVKLLLKAGLDINSKNRFGKTPLFEAVSGFGSVELIQFMINSGADVHTVSNRGTALLHMAVTDKKNKIDVLISAGANVNVLDRDLDTPLMYATNAGAEVENILALLKAGADKTLKNSRGKTAYDYAVAKNKYPQWVLELLKP